MKEIIRRLTLPSPKFFNRLKAIGGVLAGLGTSLIAIQGQYPDSAVISEIGGIAKELIVIGTVIVAVSQLTVKPDVPNSNL